MAKRATAANQAFQYILSSPLDQVAMGIARKNEGCLWKKRCGIDQLTVYIPPPMGVQNNRAWAHQYPGEDYDQDLTEYPIASFVFRFVFAFVFLFIVV